MTHEELVKRAERWLMNTIGCSFCLTEFTTIIGEIPDAIGFKNGQSILIECKATRADFLRDKKKRFRKRPELGVGKYRFYLCPPGLIKPYEPPEKWGLLYCRDRSVERVVAPRGNTFHKFPAFDFNYKNEIQMLCSALRRVHIRGDLQKIYDRETL